MNKTNKMKVWAYLLGYYNDNEFMPTLQEISDNAIDRKLSRQGAKYILLQLEKDGKIKLEPSKIRGISLCCDNK